MISDSYRAFSPSPRGWRPEVYVMPVYEYEHSDQFCSLGKSFDVTQSVHDAILTSCPQCGKPVRKLISLSHINTPKTNSELRDQGFTKLVRRDDGVYENMTSPSPYIERFGFEEYCDSVQYTYSQIRENQRHTTDLYRGR